jgi:hypothetical protein
MKICPNCPREYEDEQKFCRDDGGMLQPKSVGKHCPKCGGKTEEGERFCRHCGGSLETPKEAAPKRIETPETQQVAIPQEVKSESLDISSQREENFTERIDTPVIQWEETAQQSVPRQESPLEAAEKHVKEGNYKEAIAVLEPIVKKSPDNQEARLLELLASIKLYNIYAYTTQLDSIKSFANLSEKERGIVREIFLVAAEESRKQGQEEAARGYQRLASRVILGQSLMEPAPKNQEDQAPPRGVEAKSFPETDGGSIPPFPPKMVSSPAPNPTAPVKETPVRTTKKAKGVLKVLTIILGVAVVLSGGLLLYYNQTTGESVTSLLGKMFPGNEPPPPEVRTSGKADVAQVISAEELGFKVSGDGAADANRRDALISEKIKSQLDSLRSVYQQQSQQKPNLMGSITLQMTISPSGQVTKVEEFASQIKDAEFKKSVVDEVYKWRFPEASSGIVIVKYPLLFVLPGMDVATLLKIEQSIAPKISEPEKSTDSPSPSEDIGAGQQAKEPAIETPIKPEVKRTPPARPQPPTIDKDPRPVPAETPRLVEPPQRFVTTPYEATNNTFVYREPREDAPRIASIAAGTKLNVVAVRGDWLEVRSRLGNPPGFIKKDSAAPVGNR